MSDAWESRDETRWADGPWNDPVWASRPEGRGASGSSSGASSSPGGLRRHSQPRHGLPVGVETGPEGLDADRFDETRFADSRFGDSRFDDLRLDDVADHRHDNHRHDNHRQDEQLFDDLRGGPFPADPVGTGFDAGRFGGGDEQAGTPESAWPVPNGRRPDPSSLDPGLTGLRLPAEPERHATPRWAGADPFPEDEQWAGDASLQPGVRRRVGPRHGAGAKRDERTKPATPLRAALGAGSEVVVVLGMALLLSLLIKTFLVQAFFIPSSSMENTLLIGDRVLVSKLTPGVFQLHRGDIVVFKDPGGWLTAERGTPPQEESGVGATFRNALSFVGLLPQDAGEHLIKRVIGVGGDHVVCCDTQGRVSVNGTAVDETPYLVPGAAPSDRPFDVTVPYGYLWVMGDNRPVSADSRLHRTLNNGMVPVHDVVGKAFVVVWPFDRAGGLGTPGSVFAKIPDPPPSTGR